MREIMVNQAQSCDLKDLVLKFIPELIGREIEKATSSIYPLQNVFIRKAKILKAPKFDLGKLMEVCSFYVLYCHSVSSSNLRKNKLQIWCFSFDMNPCSCRGQISCCIVKLTLS